MNKITMLGTGNATVTQIYNTCFVLATDTTRLLVDAHSLSYGGEDACHSQGEKYSQEAAEYFKGRIVVPDDLEVIEL